MMTMHTMSTMQGKRRTQAVRVGLAMALTIAAACSDATGPSKGTTASLNTDAALADYSAMDSVLQSSGLKHFQMTAAGMSTLGGGAPTLSVSASLVPSAPSSIRLISTGRMGKTFVYDSVGHTWVADTSRHDAPANGVRFLTYEPKGAEPDASKPTGYADLVDRGATVAGISLQLIVVEGSLTILDYQTTVDDSNGIGHVAVDGYLQDAHDKLDFSLDVRGQTANGVERADVSVDMGIASRKFHVQGDLHSEKLNGADQHSTVDLCVKHGDASFRVDVANDLGALSGAVNLNDFPFANVGGTDQQPVFTDPSGGTLTLGQVLVLSRIFDISEDVGDLFEDLIDPIDDLVILAIVL